MFQSPWCSTISDASYAWNDHLKSGCGFSPLSMVDFSSMFSVALLCVLFGVGLFGLVWFVWFVVFWLVVRVLMLFVCVVLLVLCVCLLAFCCLLACSLLV